MLDESKTNSATGGDGFQPVTPKNTPQNENNTDSLARTVPDLPTFLTAPSYRGLPSVGYLTPDEIWQGVLDHVLEVTDDARDEIELLDYELSYLKPRALKWYELDIVAQAAGELDSFNSKVPGDEDDYNDTLHAWREFTMQKAKHEATLQRYSFWRQLFRYGVPQDEMTTARANEFLGIAREVFKDRKEWEWAGLRSDMLIGAMGVRA